MTTRILAIETSCDETAAAVVENGTTIISNVVASSHDMHKKYGGIVPEVAAREQVRSIIPVITEALEPLQNRTAESPNATIKREVDAIAITHGPGLIGSLLVGVETAKTLSLLTGKPLIPVNHVVAHMYACFVTHETNQKPGTKNQKVAFPAISLVVSGGHTELYLMRSHTDLEWLGGTIDDAAGEAFDKTARLLGFGNGGGPAIERAALTVSRVKSQASNIALPRPMIRDESFNFSFSGLKTAVLREWQAQKKHAPQYIAHLAYEIQEAITDVLVHKTLRARKLHAAQSVLLSGGVAANTRLRDQFHTSLADSDISLHVPPPALCTDNAVSIAAAAHFAGTKTVWSRVTAHPELSVEIGQ